MLAEMVGFQQLFMEWTGKFWLEAFLKEVGNVLLRKAHEWSKTKIKCERTKKIKKLVMRLRKAKNLVVANTDKTNAVMVVQKEDYIKWTKGHM